MQNRWSNSRHAFDEPLSILKTARLIGVGVSNVQRIGSVTIFDSNLWGV
jgi:hypothetical protein